MVLFNYSTKELTAKIVYYGPGLCGKTTNLQYIHGNLPDQVKGKMLSLATKTDRTLFFDFLPIDLGDIRGMKTRVQLYTVPGQVFYNETRKLVLKGADGIVFVADSQEAMLQANLESFKNLEENLKGHAMRLADMPHVIQFNKRDLPRLSSIEDLNSSLNRYNAPFYESVATTGIGVQDTLKAIVKLVLLHLTRKYDPKGTGSERAAAPRPAPAPAPVPVPVRPSPVQSIPLSSLEVDAPLAPAIQPAARPAAVAASVAAAAPAPAPDLAFDAAEVDVLVDEVQEASPTWQPEESAAAWQTDMGAAEEDAPEPWAASGVAPIDVLEDVPEVEVAPEPEADAWTPAPAESDPFELDRGFDPDWSAQPPAHEAPVPAPPAAAPPMAAAVVLTDVLSSASLFQDPDLEVARLTPGQAREIRVPVELGEGGQQRRFVLTLRLSVTPAD
jgi:signal recognition particle receptor subunit beta